MEKYTDILQFLDGALSHEEEAELLHRLSVSPERRDVLRNYIDQRVLFQRDREAINVPYAAEQKLWSRLAEFMPATSAVTVPAGTAAVSSVTATSGLRWFSVASVGAVCVVIGLLSGYFLGRNTAASDQIVATAPTPLVLAAGQPDIQTSASVPQSADRIHTEITRTRHRSEAPLSAVLAERTLDLMPLEPAVVTPNADDITLAGISAAALRSETPYVLEPRERARSLRSLVEATQQNDEAMYSMELSFAESFGKQFPENATSRNTQPIITNSTISAMLQLYHGPIELWAGANIGSANLAKRTLREDPQPGGGSELVADINHMQATWVGLSGQARHRFDDQISVSTSAGLAYSAIGPLFFGEAGVRYDLTDQVGITAGLRGFYLRYDLTQEQEDVIRNAIYKMDTGGPNYGSEWSHNFELLTGMYFRF